MRKQSIALLIIACGGAFMLNPGKSLAAASVVSPAQEELLLPVGPKIRVLLERNVPSALIEAKGSYQVVRGDTGQLLSSGKVGKRFVVHALPDGLRWGEEYPDIYQVSIVPTSSRSSVYVNGLQYKGSLSVYHVQGKVTIVNEVAIEEYLKSTLASELDGESLSEEALKAVAIVARTAAYQKLKKAPELGSQKKRGYPWEVVAKEVGYWGHGITQQGGAIDTWVDWSRYMIVETSQQHEPFQIALLAPARAEELARQGWDAQKILKTVFPRSKIGATIHPDEVAVR